MMRDDLHDGDAPSDGLESGVRPFFGGFKCVRGSTVISLSSADDVILSEFRIIISLKD